MSRVATTTDEAVLLHKLTSSDSPLSQELRVAIGNALADSLQLKRTETELRGLLAEAEPGFCYEQHQPHRCARLCSTWRKKLRELL